MKKDKLDFDEESWRERADEPLLFVPASEEEQEELSKNHPFPDIEELLAEIKRAQNA